MTTIGFSDGKDTLQVASREDFVVFFRIINKVHTLNVQQSYLELSNRVEKFPLLAHNLYRGWVKYNDIDALEHELELLQKILSKVPTNLLLEEALPEKTKINISAKNMHNSFSIFWDRLRTSIEGSREYKKLGHPEYPVRTIVAEVPACSTMLGLPEEAFFKLDEPPLWTFYGESRDGVIVLDGSDW